MSFKTSIRPFFKAPKRMVKSPRLTIREMARGTSKNTVKKSKQVVGLEEAWEGNVPKALAAEGYICYRGQTRNKKNGNQYRLAVFSPTPRVTRDTKVIIDSPNPLHVFRYEYALAKRGNAFIYRSNGDAPVVTNPRLKAGLDHHMHHFLLYLVQNTDKNGLKVQEKIGKRSR